MGRSRPAVHRTIVVVDVEGFGDRRRTNAHQVEIRTGLYQAIRKAFNDANVSWTNCDHEDRGDGVFILAPADIPKSAFIDAVSPALVTALRDHNAMHPVEERIRLRMVLHAGEVELDEHGATAASVNLAFRLLDAQPLRAALARSPGVLAVIASEWFFDEVVRHSRQTDPATFRPHRLVVKETSTVAWISLPDSPYPPAPAHLSSLPLTGSFPNDLSGKPPVPRQLPLAIRDFTGRTEHLAALDALLLGNKDTKPDGAGTVMISALHGTAGVGKTALAVHWAHQVQHQFPDGTLHVNLRGHGPGEPATPAEVIDGFLRALGATQERIPVGLDAQVGLYRSLLAGRQMLIVLDNANAPEQVRLLLPGSSGCMVLITSRACLTGLLVGEAATRVEVDLMSPHEAIALVTRIVGPQRAEAEPHAVAELTRACARLPLALRIAASRITAHPHLTLAEILAELTDDDQRLDALSASADAATAMRAVFDRSYRDLSDESARMFRLFGLHRGPNMIVHAAAALAGVPVAHARRLLDRLVSVHLLQGIGGGRYRCHDLLRVYAAERAAAEEPQAERQLAVKRVLHWYLHTAYAANHTLSPQRADPPIEPSQFTLPLLEFTTYDEALSWCEAEMANLIAAPRLALDFGEDVIAWKIPVGCWNYIFLRKRWSSWISAHEMGLAGARRIGDQFGEAWTLNNVAHGFRELRQFKNAGEHLEHALEIRKEIGDQVGLAWTITALGFVDYDIRRYESAVKRFTEVLQIREEVAREHRDDETLSLADRHGQGIARASLGDSLRELGRFDEALHQLQEALRIFREIKDPHGEGYTLAKLGDTFARMHRPEDALASFEQALTTRREIGDRWGEAETLHSRGRVLLATGEPEAAREAWRHALAIFTELDAPSAEDVRTLLSTTHVSSSR
jgi:tetratricopeptide (TPR) repeat protein